MHPRYSYAKWWIKGKLTSIDLSVRKIARKDAKDNEWNEGQQSIREESAKITSRAIKNDWCWSYKEGKWIN
jgi:hypothetical protein